MRQLWADWVDVWRVREPATALALFRIAVALIVAHNLGTLWLDDVGPLLVDPEFGGISERGHRYPPLRGFPVSTDLLWLLVAAGEVLSVGLLVGIGGRWTPLLLSQVCMAVYGFHPGTGGGHDRLITGGLWLLFLSPAHETLSIRGRLRDGGWLNTATFAWWPRALGIAQLGLMYFVTGLSKQGASWFPAGDYRALYHSFLLPSWQRFDLSAVAWIYPVTQIGTLAAWWWETTFVVVLLNMWARSLDSRRGPIRWLASVDLRWPYIILGIVTHGTLFLTMNLGPFSAITLAYYLLLIRPEEWEAWAQRIISRRVMRNRGPP